MAMHAAARLLLSTTAQRASRAVNPAAFEAVRPLASAAAEELKRTVLYDFHVSLGAKVRFAFAFGGGGGGGGSAIKNA